MSLRLPSEQFPLSFPPVGKVLACICLLFLLPGLIGHDPWKTDDAVAIGIAWNLVSEGHWLAPQLAGELWNGPPLFYWVAALFGKILSFALPFHDGARLASGFFAAISLVAVYHATRLSNDHHVASAATLLLAGCLGLTVHGHEAQSLLPVLAGYSGTLFAICLLAARSTHNTSAAILLIVSLVVTLLGGGFAWLLAPLLLVLVAPLTTRTLRTSAYSIAATWALALSLLVGRLYPGGADLGLLAVNAVFTPVDRVLPRMASLAQLLGWFAWPALPLALWAIWQRRRQLAAPHIALPLVAFLLVWVVAAMCADTRNHTALPLLAPLAVLGAQGAPLLRRGAANAFDWFAMMTFTLAGFLVWLGWLAMQFGIPPRIAANFARLEPGYLASFSLFPAVLAAAITGGWLWLIARAPRSPYRSTVVWSAGVISGWALVMLLWLPWIDYGKTYRPIAESLKTALAASGSGCVGSLRLGDAQRASLDYFAGIRTHRVESGARFHCDRQLIVTTGRGERIDPGKEWTEIWVGHRPGDKAERWRLYQRNRQLAGGDVSIGG